MMNIDIKHTFRSMVVLMATVFALVACMNDDTIATTPECAITGFSINSITCDVPSKKYDKYGNATDTIISKTLYGSQVFFNIDQLNGHIYTVDSLPKWVDLTEVIPYTTSWGNVYYKLQDDDELYYPLVSGSTVIDFSKTVEMLCSSTDGLSKRIYQVDLYQHKHNIDTLEWKALTSNLSITGASKPFYVDDKVFLFAQNESQQPVMTFAEKDNATTWSVPVNIPVDNGSIVLFNDNFYGLGDDGYIYCSAPNQLGVTWTKASDRPVERLLAADAFYLYAYDGTAIIGADKDLNTWQVEGAEDLDMLPETSINSVSHPASTNNDLQVVVMTGLSSQNSKNGVSWYKNSTQDAKTNQPWAYIQVTPDNAYGMPHFDHASVTYYQGVLYAIGIEEDAYALLYRSDDNGITWHPQSKKYPMPKELKPANGVASIVAVDEKLWIIQENGKVWQGSIL